MSQLLKNDRIRTEKTPARGFYPFKHTNLLHHPLSLDKTKDIRWTLYHDITYENILYNPQGSNDTLTSIFSPILQLP
jgi:hypothetical protein